MPKLPVEAPTKYMQNLIPRLTQTIKDIDELQFRIGWGAQEGMMDNWSAYRKSLFTHTYFSRSSLLTAYSILLTRIQAISTSFSQAAIIAKPGQPILDQTGEGSSSTASAAPVPIPLSRILLHPRLPQTTETTDFLTVIALTTQQPFPAVKQAQDELIQRTVEEEGLDGDGIKGKDEEELDQMLEGLRDRLAKENNRASLVADYIRGLEEEYEWQGRIDDEEEEEEDSEAKERLVGSSAKPSIIEVDMEDAGNTVTAGRVPKTGWSLDDWVRYRETGQEPAV